MRFSTTLTAIVLTLGATLSLTACGSSAKTSGAIKGAQSSPASPSATASPNGTGPTITLPADLHVEFQWNPTGDPQKDAVIHDTEQYLLAFNQAMVRQNPNDSAYLYYSEGTAAQYVHDQTQQMVIGGYAPTGTDRFYRDQVAVDGTAAGITFCEDQSQNFGKSVKTGKILRTTPSDADYYFYNISLTKDSTKGVWKAHSITVWGKAVQCKG